MIPNEIKIITGLCFKFWTITLERDGTFSGDWQQTFVDAVDINLLHFDNVRQFAQPAADDIGWLANHN